jgi:hypothetical protein
MRVRCTARLVFLDASSRDAEGDGREAEGVSVMTGHTAIGGVAMVTLAA